MESRYTRMDDFGIDICGRGVGADFLALMQKEIGKPATTKPLAALGTLNRLVTRAPKAPPKSKRRRPAGYLKMRA